MNETPKKSWWLTALFGTVALVGLIGGGVAWANYTKISGAVVASGNIIVEGQPKSVQHLDGGIVSQISVDAGDTVVKDQLLVSLDDTQISANLRIYERRLRDALVQRARLQAELDGSNTFTPPVDEARRFELGNLREAVSGQVTLMRARKLTRESETGQYDEKVSQFENQIRGVRGVAQQKKSQILSFREEMKGMKTLVDKRLAPKSRLMTLERSEADLRGQIAEHISEIGRLQNAIAEARLAKTQTERRFRERAVTELEEAISQIDELTQQLTATRAQLSRIEIRAPVSGIVHELSLFTIGGVVQPGQTVMQIIPGSDAHELEVYVDPVSIDEVRVGLEATLRFPAFNARTTPELLGTVSKVSPASVIDEQSGVGFYRVIVSVSETEAKRLGEKILIPGMPVEALIPTSERTVLSYLVKPFSDHLERAFREE